LKAFKLFSLAVQVLVFLMEEKVAYQFLFMMGLTCLFCAY